MKDRGRWRVVNVELSAPLPELGCDAGYDGVRVVFQWKGVPLGHRRFTAAQLPLAPHLLANCAAQCAAAAVGDRMLEGFASPLPGLPPPPLERPQEALAALLAVDRPLAALDQTLAGPAPACDLTVSVAVCTRERPEALARCLSALAASSQPPLEILVVDNAPRTNAAREVASRYPGVRYVLAPRAGLSAARNAAMAAASGDVIAFADDDVVVHRSWVARIRRCFEDPKVMAALGLVLPAELETPAQLMFEEHFGFFHRGYRRRRFDAGYFAALRGKEAPVWDIGAGANMAIRRRAFVRGYQFDTRLGPGVFGGCGEDSEFWYRLLADGWTCVYEPSAVVYHYHRREMGALRRQVRQYMQGHVAALLLQFQRYRHWGNLRRLFLTLPGEYALLALRTAVTAFSLENRILMGGALGCLSGLRFAIPWRRAR